MFIIEKNLHTKVQSLTFSSTFVKTERDPLQLFLLLIISRTPKTCSKKENVLFTSNLYLKFCYDNEQYATEKSTGHLH